MSDPVPTTADRLRPATPPAEADRATVDAPVESWLDVTGPAGRSADLEHVQSDRLVLTPDLMVASDAPRDPVGAPAAHADVRSRGDIRLADDDAEPGEIDEAMLRDLVERIVREELQGDLGRRMTQNLRKLIRRELNTALTLRG